jgi:hypothetical protein
VALHRGPELRSQQVQRAITFLGEYGWERQGVELVTFYRNLLET